MTQSAKINLSSVVVQSKKVLASGIDGEVVMMGIEHGTYSALDAMGSGIWDILKDPRPVSEICEILMERYEVERERCEEEVLAFLNDLASDGTIEVVGSEG
jgi:hypothetical protein